MTLYHYQFTGDFSKDLEMIRLFTKYCVDEQDQQSELNWIDRHFEEIKEHSSLKKIWYQEHIKGTAYVEKSFENLPYATIAFHIPDKVLIGELRCITI